MALSSTVPSIGAMTDSGLTGDGDAVPDKAPETESGDTATHQARDIEPDDPASDEAPKTQPGDTLTDELPEEIRAAAAKLQAGLKDPNRPKRDHFGTFDPIYRLLRWIRWSRIGKKLPIAIMKPIRYLMHVIVIYDDYPCWHQ
jgi:hypothetical protein